MSAYVCSVCAESAEYDPWRCLVCDAIMCAVCAGVERVCPPCREQVDRLPDGSLDKTAARIRREAGRREQ